LDGLALLYSAQGKYQKAELLLQRCLSIAKAKLPAGHSEIDLYQSHYDTLKKKMTGQ
jgi:hypothetical protein